MPFKGLAFATKVEQMAHRILYMNAAAIDSVSKLLQPTTILSMRSSYGMAREALTTNLKGGLERIRMRI
jgi:hypothetical protein